MTQPPEPQRPRNSLYRRETRSGRRLTRTRAALYRLAVPLAAALIRLWWRWSPVVRVIGDEHAARAIADGAVIPVYWHQHLLHCIRYLLDQQARGLKLGFLISPSLDGEVASMLAARAGAHVIRGSSNTTGARALRDYYVALQQGLSPSITPDGPTGPRYEFKAGPVLLAQMSGRPMLPLAFHATRAWRFRTWDRFVLPVPFSKVVVAVGEPRHVPRGLDAEALQRWQQTLADELATLYAQARDASRVP
jgi:lysophospholipid acyltransferase (LPLAT)-like uncharacterized protein